MITAVVVFLLLIFGFGDCREEYGSQERQGRGLQLGKFVKSHQVDFCFQLLFSTLCLSL